MKARTSRATHVEIVEVERAELLRQVVVVEVGERERREAAGREQRGAVHRQAPRRAVQVDDARPRGPCDTHIRHRFVLIARKFTAGCEDQNVWFSKDGSERRPPF